MNFATGILKEPTAYTGDELRPHFLLSRMGLKGSALGAFIGPCHVKTESLVDWEDRLANDRIDAKLMVHFIGEFFGRSLREGVLAQRLLMAMICQTLNRRQKKFVIRREGDDLFITDRKLSVSIVTASPVSQLLHAGINIDPEGAPVPAVGVQEFGLESGTGPDGWISEVLSTFSEEWEGVEWACAKVRPVM